MEQSTSGDEESDRQRECEYSVELRYGLLTFIRVMYNLSLPCTS
jgi:hypothetical protein